MLHSVVKSVGFVIVECLIVIVMNVRSRSGEDGLCVYMLLIF